MNITRYLTVVAAVIRRDGFLSNKQANKEDKEPTWLTAQKHCKVKSDLKITQQDRDKALKALDFFSERFLHTKNKPFLLAMKAVAHKEVLLDKHLPTAAWILPTYDKRNPNQDRPPLFAKSSL